jgi:hypothetical protein
MPDGGHDARGNCFHFRCDEPFDRQNPESWRCSLREVSVDADPYWTTCDNCAEETSEPSGPMRAVVGGMGKKGVPIQRRFQPTSAFLTSTAAARRLSSLGAVEAIAAEAAAVAVATR